jgi:UDP-glucose 4-epimerase
MSTLVIGGTGFIGEYLCRELVQRKEKVIVVSRPGFAESEKIAGVQYKVIDLDVNPLDLKKIIGAVDRVVLALQPDVVRMKKLISIFSSADSIKKIVYLSTLLVYPDSVLKQNEDTEPAPWTEYEKNKYAEEKLLGDWAREKNYQLCIARLGNVYGDIKNKGVINGIILALLNNTLFEVDGDGKNLRDYIFVEDVANILSDLIINSSPEFARIFNVCTGHGSSVIDVIDDLEKITDKKVTKSFKTIAFKLKNVIGDNQKVFNLTNKAPLSLTEGLKKAYNNYLK